MMNKIEIKFLKKLQANGQTRFEKETLHIEWEDIPAIKLEIIYIQVIRTKNHNVFHTFLSTNQLINILPLRIHDDPSSYTFRAYGMSVKRSNLYYYIIQNAAMSSIDKLLQKGEDVGKLTLMPDFKYEMLKDEKQKSYGFDVEQLSEEKYEITGFRKTSKNICHIIVMHQHYPQTTSVFIYTDDSYRQVIPFDVPGARDFSIQYFRIQKGTGSCFLGFSHSKVQKFKSYMTPHHVYELYEKAVKFVRRRPALFGHLVHFYRNKSREYFRDIMENKNGVMHKYSKNWGGDQYSTLNQKLHGLFFSAHVDPQTGLPKPISYYGPVRLYIPTGVLLTGNTSLYFSDFYCHYMNHKVQLIITVNDSPSDNFCKTRLLRIDPWNNPFWFARLGNLFVTTNVTVEVFYTEDIPIRHFQLLFGNTVYFENCETIGNSMSMVIGIPKNESCNVCNLEHVIETRGKMKEIEEKAASG